MWHIFQIYPLWLDSIRPFVCKEGFSAHEFLSELHDGIKPSIYIWHDLDISLLSHKTKSAATFSIWKAISQGTLTVLGYCSTLCIHRFLEIYVLKGIVMNIQPGFTQTCPWAIYRIVASTNTSRLVTPHVTNWN